MQAVLFFVTTPRTLKNTTLVKKWIVFYIFNIAILFKIYELVVKDDVIFVKIASVHHVTTIKDFKRAERVSGRPNDATKAVLLFFFTYK